MGHQRPWRYFWCTSIWTRGQFALRGHGLESPGRQIPGVRCKVDRVLVIRGLRRATGRWQDGESSRRRHLRPDGYRVGRRDYVRAARQESRRLSIRSWQRHCFSPLGHLQTNHIFIITAYSIRTTDLPTPCYTLYCSQYMQLRKGNMTNGSANGITGHCSVTEPAGY